MGPTGPSNTGVLSNWVQWSCVRTRVEPPADCRGPGELARPDVTGEESDSLARYVLRLRRLLIHHVLHADDTPHRISLGVALATLVAFLPLVGFQTIIAVGLAALCRANKAVCVPIVWITNPFTLWPIYGGCLALGRVVLASPPSPEEAAVLAQLEQGTTARFYELAYWKALLDWPTLFDRLVGLGEELWVGCIIVGVVLGIVSYFLSRWAIVRYRERRRRRILKRNLMRSQLQANKFTRRGEPV